MDTAAGLNQVTQGVKVQTDYIRRPLITPKKVLVNCIGCTKNLNAESYLLNLLRPYNHFNQHQSMTGNK